MASLLATLFFLILLFFSSTELLANGDAVGPSAAKTYILHLHHRFSDLVKTRLAPHEPHVRKGTAAYYSALAAGDLALGHVSNASPGVTFSGGNVTERISTLGFLHYAVVSVGTPTIDFVVALDTGSDLFWIPCCDREDREGHEIDGADCSNAVATMLKSSEVAERSGFGHAIYNPSMSLTSKRVNCSSHFCDLQSECSDTSSHCPYKISYVSANTSSSGTLIEDVLYLTTEDTRPVIEEARIVFGCGQVQTGSFLDVAAPNGLLGLGMENVSVPSVISSNGLSANSFSMCFRHDGIGRISFGDQGNPDQEETPFNVDELNPTYNITITGVTVGIVSTDLEFTALVDSGTSFTYLTDPAYTTLTENFISQVQEDQHDHDSRIPFDYCFDISSRDTELQTPKVNLTTKGGSHFPVTDPVIIINIQDDEHVYCLAVVKSNKLNIIGQNFMTGLRIVFDRERLVLGWMKSNCYDPEESSTLPLSSLGSSETSPSVADGASNYTPGGTSNDTYVAVLAPPFSLSSELSCIDSIFFIFIFMIMYPILGYYSCL